MLERGFSEIGSIRFFTFIFTEENFDEMKRAVVALGKDRDLKTIFYFLFCNQEKFS